MPWHIENDNPECGGWAVVKDSSGEVEGCHQTKAAAEAQLTALNIAEYGDEGDDSRLAGGPKAIICDIDDTLLTSGVRPVRRVIDYVNALEGKLYIVTGRVEADEAETRRALDEAGVRDYDLEMKDDDSVDDGEFKRLKAQDILGEYDVTLAIDNNEGHRRIYSELGIPTRDPAAIDGARQVDLSVPAYIRRAASRGLELRADGFGGDGLTEGTVREAREMAAGRVTEDKVVRANAWGARHAVDLDSPNNSDADSDGWPGAGAVAHYLWGIDPLNPGPAREWFARKAEQVKAEEAERMNSESDTEFRFEAPRDNLTRQVTFRAASESDGQTLEGYAAVFNEWTDIDSWEGTFRERVAPGAFKKTLSERMPVLQFDHGTHPLIGSIPLGVFTALREDENGLFVRGRLSDNWLVEPVRDAIRDGAITGMSFKFRVIRDSWAKGKGNVPERTIQEIALYEAGPVVFPAYEQTSVGMRSREVLTALTDPEVRHELALMLASGTDATAFAADTESEPTVDGHSPRSVNQRKAAVVLHNL